MAGKRKRGEIDPVRQSPDGKIKPGQTLNLKGRTPGSQNVSDMRARVLTELIKVEIAGRKRKMPVVEATFRKLVQEALKGDKQSIAMVVREYAALEERQARTEETTFHFSDADRQTIDEIFARMRACEPAKP